MERLWQSDLENGSFRNPVLFADYSDPDVIRVGDTYYMTASSFNYIPGLPILTSRDLVNWKLRNYAIDEIGYESYDIPQHSKGVWAPAIRYHEGYFYIYYGMPDEGIFMVRAEDPLGVWEKPVLVLAGKGLIDSCPFWDEDGRAYIIHGYAKSRIGFKSHLGIFPMSWDGTRAVGEDHILYNGLETQPTIEGPKVYKRNGYYYILAPAGGVKQGWQTALRSRNIYGPYEEKIVLRQGNSPINGPHQGALVDTVNGDEWFVHFQDRGLYGRIVHIQPVVWENDWPVMGICAADGCGKPCIIGKKPDTGVTEEPCYLEASDDFAGQELNLLWQWLGNPKPSFYSLTGQPGFLRLYCVNPSGREHPTLWESANVLTQKLVCPYFEAEVCLHLDGLLEREQAGMVMMGGHYAYLAVRIRKGKKELVLGTSYDSEEGRKEKREPLLELPNDSRKIYLIFAMENSVVPNSAVEASDVIESAMTEAAMKKGAEEPVFRMYYALEDSQGADSGLGKIPVKTDFMPSDHTWVGAKIGLFALAGEKEAKGGYGDFAYIHVTAAQE